MNRKLKIEAARAAVAQVEEGMRLGIGTGSTADEFTILLGERVKSGLSIIGVPTSEKTAKLCRELAIPLTTLDKMPVLDLTVDGADEIDSEMNLIKGAGGALLREKIVASASSRMIVIADDTKLVKTLGGFPLPIEVNPFGLESTKIAIEAILAGIGDEINLVLRMESDDIFLTDGGHYILDASFRHIRDAQALSDKLLAVPGVVQHGLFLDMADEAFIAGQEGVSHLTRAG